MATSTMAYTTPHVLRDADDTLQRAQRALDVHPRLHVAPRLAEAAQSLTAVGLAATHAELLNASLMHCVRLAYAIDTDGRYANIDMADGRIRFAVPWGSSGHKTWGLRRREADILREALLVRCEPRQGQALPLFTFDAGKWFVNLSDYPTEQAALSYLKQAGVTAREYKLRLEDARKVDRE